MIPNVFISSTIADLQHLREALKDSIEELAYRPVLSEFGDIGYLPQVSAEDSCYLTMRDCQIAVLIVGKRYGSLSANGSAITHNEFIVARENKIPIVCLVEREVLSFKKVFDANSEIQSAPAFPGMDFPSKSFNLIQEIMDAPTNNGILPFSSIAEARTLLKEQLAHIYGDLLRSKFDPVKAEIKDILSEIMTLRQELKNGNMDWEPFLRATRFLLDDHNRTLRGLLECISGNVENAIPVVIKCKTFEDYLIQTGTELTVNNTPVDQKEMMGNKDLVAVHHFIIADYNNPVKLGGDVAYWNMSRDQRLTMNAIAKQSFDYSYERLRKASLD